MCVCVYVLVGGLGLCVYVCVLVGGWLGLCVYVCVLVGGWFSVVCVCVVLGVYACVCVRTQLDAEYSFLYQQPFTGYY